MKYIEVKKIPPSRKFVQINLEHFFDSEYTEVHREANEPTLKSLANRIRGAIKREGHNGELIVIYQDRKDSGEHLYIWNKLKTKKKGNAGVN